MNYVKKLPAGSGVFLLKILDVQRKILTKKNDFTYWSRA